MNLGKLAENALKLISKIPLNSSEKKSVKKRSKGDGHFLLSWFHFWGGCLWHFPSSDLHEVLCAYRKNIGLHGFTGFSALINLLMTSNAL